MQSEHHTAIPPLALATDASTATDATAASTVSTFMRLPLSLPPPLPQQQRRRQQHRLMQRRGLIT
jgi:hypothetical protein